MKSLFRVVLLALLSPLAAAASPEFGPIVLECTAAVTHQKVSAVDDSAESASLVLASDWNAVHHAPPASITFFAGSGLVWPSQPASITELPGAPRIRRDLTRMSACRLSVKVEVAGGATPAKIRAQYTTDTTGATGWTYLDAATGPTLNINATGTIVSTSVTLAAPAKADVLLRIVGIDG